MEGVILVAALALFVWLFIPKSEPVHDFKSADEMMAYVKEERKKLGKEDECS